MDKLLKSFELVRPIKKLFIANRGEIAVRAALACERRRIRAVIPYSSSDANSLVARIADRNAYDGWELAPLSGTSADETYGNAKKMLETILLHGCDAVFLGYGFLAESSNFVKMCEKENLRVLSPKAKLIEMVGNKISARAIAKKIKIGRLATIPVLEGSENLQTFADAAKYAKKLGFPVMLKDPDLGGGTGYIIATNEAELEQAYTSLRMNRNNKELFLERYITRAAHVEIQIVADNYGNVVSLGERDCTMQRRGQKLIEESPSPHISDRMKSTLETSAINFAKEIGYSGIGTWEFIIDLERIGRNNEPEWYFMEVNPRIQVEHGVTEEQTDIDIVDTMIDIAEERRLAFSEAGIKTKGHTIEARVYAEIPEENFRQSYGHLQVLDYPSVKGLRIEKGAEQGDDIAAWFDPTICKLIAHAGTRDEARQKLIEALSLLNIVGVHNNKDFLLELLETDEFVNLKGSTTFIASWWQERLKDKIYDLGGIIDGGTFEHHEPSRRFKPSLLPQDIKVPSRKSDTLTAYSEYYQTQKEKSGHESAAEFGMVERDGMRFVIYELDDKFAFGTLGVAEGAVFEDACRLANQHNIPLVTISRSGGARQHENSLALYQMGATINALNVYPPLFHINVYAGGVYGGVPASFAGIADVQIAVDSKETKIGFSGPYIVAKSLGKKPKSFRLDDAYQELPEGTHTSLHHFQMRNVDILVRSLEEASDKIAHLLHILKIPSTISDPNIVYAPPEEIGFQQLRGTGQRFDRPGQKAVAWLRDKMSGLPWKRRKAENTGRYKQLPINERLKVIFDEDRPTAADLIDKNSGVFDDVVALSSVLQIDGAEQIPPVIAAVCKIDGIPVFILGQQTQRVLDEKSGKKTKVYDPQKPADWEYTLRMLDFAQKLKLPVVLFGDTRGADSLPDSEDRNQSHKIAQVLKALDIYPYPMISINIGFKGSGGGETFIRSFDAAVDFENALSYVSDPMVQYWILTGRWIDKQSDLSKQKELAKFIEQLKDATAENRLQTHQIDEIIPEGKGGAHANPTIPANHLRIWLKKQLTSLMHYSEKDLLKRRHERIKRVTNKLTTAKT